MDSCGGRAAGWFCAAGLLTVPGEGWTDGWTGSGNLSRELLFKRVVQVRSKKVVLSGESGTIRFIRVIN